MITRYISSVWVRRCGNPESVVICLLDYGCDPKGTVGRFLPVGLLILLVLLRFFNGSVRFPIVGFLGTLLGIVLVILVCSFDVGYPWAFSGPVAPEIEGLLGIWIGTTWMQDRRTKL